jgi:hypothetical protein
MRYWTVAGYLLVVLGAACSSTTSQVEYAYQVPASNDPFVKDCALRCEGRDPNAAEPTGGLRGPEAERFVQCLHDCPRVRVEQGSCAHLELEPGTWCYPVLQPASETERGSDDEERKRRAAKTKGVVEVLAAMVASVVGEVADEDDEDPNSEEMPNE